ncbi:MAG: SpoIIE family protein phosphatase, partial [Candidatus Marinimicrobia bacterium]|nr:SpoIIE family protein phosphatase [Candidatus Neomarinimicrobiota bacterium]
FRLGYVVLGIFVLVENVFGIISGINLKLDSIGFLLSIGSLETVGFLFFLGCLGYIATSRFFENETKLAAVEREMETARRIQYSLLPAQIPDSEYFSLSALYKPMTAVAGDIYDFSQKSGDIGILVADVSGHGIPAALIASMVKTAFKTESEYLKSPAVLMENMNRALSGQFDQEFVTAAYLYMEAETGNIRFANAGHPPVLHYRAESCRVSELNSKGMILGPFAAAKYEENSHTVSPGDTLLFYTDGITETMNHQNEQFGEERLKQFLVQNHDKAPDDFSNLLLNKLQSWIAKNGEEGFTDDITLVVLQVKPQ